MMYPIQLQPTYVLQLTNLQIKVKMLAINIEQLILFVNV